MKRMPDIFLMVVYDSKYEKFNEEELIELAEERKMRINYAICAGTPATNYVYSYYYYEYGRTLREKIIDYLNMFDVYTDMRVFS